MLRIISVIIFLNIFSFDLYAYNIFFTETKILENPAEFSKLDSSKTNIQEEKINKKIHKDTIKIKKMPVVEVTSTRIFSNSAIEFTPNYTINKNQIDELAPLQISEVLNLTPGVNITDYGGLGAIKTVSLRGSGSSRTLLLIDGMPLSSSQNSSFDLTNIPVGILDNIEVVRGGASSIFGGNAIGGAINLRTDFTSMQPISMSLAVGSFGELAVNASGGYNLNNIFYSGNINYTKTNGNFDFEYNEFGVVKSVKRINSDYEDVNISLSVAKVGENWKLWSRVLFTNTNKGVPGAVLQGTLYEGVDRAKDNKLIILANGSYIFTNTSVLNFSLISKTDNSKYLEPNLQKETDFNLYDYGINLKYNFAKYDFHNEILASLYYSALEGSMLDVSVGSNVSRSTFGLAYKVEKSINNLGLLANLRFDYINNLINTNSQSAISALVGGVYSLVDIPLKAKINYSRNFRPPNFNEMYYRNYGTKNLQSEISNNFNFGISYDILNYLNIEADFFSIYTKNMILSVPKSPISWRAENIENAFSRGLELTSNLIYPIYLNKNLSIQNILFSYTLQRTVDKSNKQLIFVPQEIISSNLNLNIYNLFVGLKINYSSFIYLQTDNDNNSILPSYVLMHLYTYKNFNIRDLVFRLRFDCNNLLDKRFEMVPNYPMPGRSFRVTLSASLN